MATEGRRLERRSQLCGLSVNKRKPVNTRVSTCKSHNSLTVQSFYKSHVQNAKDLSKTLKPTTRLSSYKTQIQNAKAASKLNGVTRVSNRKSQISKSQFNKPILPRLRLTDAKQENIKDVSKLIALSRVSRNKSQIAQSQSVKTLKPRLRLANGKQHNVKDAPKPNSLSEVSDYKSQIQSLKPRTRLTSGNPQNAKAESTPRSVPQVSNSKSQISAVEIQKPNTRLGSQVSNSKSQIQAREIQKPNTRHRSRVSNSKSQIPAVGSLKPNTRYGSQVSNSKSQITIVQSKSNKNVRKQVVNISIVEDNAVTPISNKKSKKLKVNLLKLKLASQELSTTIDRNRKGEDICRCSAVLIIKDEVCDFIVDRVLPAFKSKIIRVPHATRWLRPGPANPDDYGLDGRLEDMLEDTEDRPRREVPKWARDGTAIFRQGLKITRAIDPDLLFSKCDPPYEAMMFLPMIKSKDSRSSNSSRGAIVWDDD